MKIIQNMSDKHKQDFCCPQQLVIPLHNLVFNPIINAIQRNRKISKNILTNV
jgi:hypothetical protein